MKNSFWLGLQYIVAIVASLVTLKLNLWNFGASDFGCWLTITAFWGAAFVIDAGFSTSAVVFIAEARKKHDAPAIDRICSTAFCFFIAGAALLYGLAWFLMHIVLRSSLFSSFPASLPVATLSSLVGIAGAFSFIQGGLRSFFEGMEEFAVVCKIGIASIVLSLVFISAVAFWRMSLIALSMANVLSAVIAVFATLTVFRLKFRHIHLSPRNISIQTARSLFTFGFQVQLATIFGSLIDPVIKFSLGKFLGMEQVSCYEIARRFAIAFSGLFSTAFRNILPASSKYSAGSDFRGFLQSNMLQRIISFGNIYSGFFFGVCAIATWGLMHYWFGSDGSLRYFFLLAMAETVNIMFYPFYVSLIGDRKTGILVLLQLINFCLIACSILLGCRLFRSNLVLFSYVLSVAAADVILYFYFKKTYSYDILKGMGMGCLLKFVCLLLFLGSGIAATFAVSGLIAVLFVSVASGLLNAADYARIIRTRRLTIS
jgi:O-antigen/teichoic acid export membrane protein